MFQKDTKGIYKVSDLSLLSSSRTGKYMLMADLDLSSAEQASISVFRGTLDGNNHTIKGLKADCSRCLKRER